jgi:hypothetical protein
MELSAETERFTAYDASHQVALAILVVVAVGF